MGLEPKDAEVGAEIEPLVKAIALESMREAEDITAINPLGNNTNIHNDAETAARAGLREPLASCSGFGRRSQPDRSE